MIVDGITLSGGTLQGDNLWLSGDGKISYRYDTISGALQIFTLVGGNFVRAASIEHFPSANAAGEAAGALGINLKQGAAPDSITYFPATGLYNVVELSLVARAVQTGGKADNVQGNGGDDHIKLGAGNDLAMGWGGNDFIDGEDGNDYIIGGINNAAPGFIDSDTIIGGNERDWLRGYDGNDVMHGGRIDDHQLTSNSTGQTFGDWLTGDRGQDILYGSAAGDFLEGGAGADEVWGGAGDDLILGDGELMQNSGTLGAGGDPNIIYWSDHGSGILRPTSGATILFLSGGMFNWTLGRTVIPGADDSVSMDYIDYQFTIGTGRTLSGARTSANGGDDLLYGGLGNDWIAGQTGSDVLYGDAGDDVLYGDDLNMSAAQSGDDWLYGGIGADRLYGGEGDDHLYANSGNVTEDDGVEDLLYGGAGDDHLFGGQNDKLYGGAGDDNLSSWGVYGAQLHGGTGDDQLFAAGIAAQAWGDAGDDTLTFERSADFVDGGEGFDTYFFNADSLRLPGSTEIRDSDGKGLININNTRLNQSALRAQKDGSWLAANGEFSVTQEGSTLTITLFENGQALLGKVRVTDYSDGHLGINLPVYVDPDVPDVPDVPPNHAPTPGALLAPPKAKVGQVFHFAIPNDAFSDIDEGDSLSLAATLADGSALPAWLVFDAATQTFSGTPSSTDNRNIQIRLTATDQGGLSSSHVFDFAIMAANLVINGGSGNNTLTGDSGDDVIYFQAQANNTIDGGAGNDQIIVTNDYYGSGAYSNTITGGQGNDRIVSGASADTYLFNRGDGQDTISDFGYNYWNQAAGQDRLVFGAGIKASDLTYSRSNNDLIVKINNPDNPSNPNNPTADDQITIQNWFADPGWQIEQFVFVDGDGDELTLSAEQVSTLGNFIYGTSGADTLTGGLGSNHLLAGVGDDLISFHHQANNTIDGGAGHDQIIVTNDYYGSGAYSNIITGGQGNDRIVSGASADTYLFNRGDGQDTISDFGYNYWNQAAGQDRLVFGAGIKASDLTYSRSNNDLIVKINNPDNPSNPNNPTADDQITIQNWFADPGWQIEQFVFVDSDSDGDGNELTLSAEQISTLGNFIYGTSDADTLTGGLGSNHLFGEAGDDLISFHYQANNTIDGGAGHDQIIVTNDYYGSGATSNTIAGGQGNDRMVSGASADTYLFNRGDGQDTISDFGYNYWDQAAGQDRLVFGAGIKASDLTYSRSDNDLIVKISDPSNPAANDQITIEKWFADPGWQIEQFVFVDGDGNGDGNELRLNADEVTDAAQATGQKAQLALSEVSSPAISQTRAMNLGVDAWAFTHALLDRHLSSANGAVLGDDLVTPSALASSLNALGNSPTQPLKNEMPSQMHSLRPPTALQEGLIFG